MKMSFASSWNSFDRCPHYPMDADDARRHHEGGEPYAAVFSDETLGPRIVVDVWTTNEFVNVTFLDDLKRILTTFTFSTRSLQLVRDPSPRPKKRPEIRAPAGLYFLQKIVHTDEFFGDTDKAQMATSYSFEQSGFMRARRRWFPSQDIAEQEAQVDVSAHWEPGPPSFGAYDGYLVYGRWTPPPTLP